MSHHQQPLSKEQMLARVQEELDRPPFHAFLAPRTHSADPESGEIVIELPWQDAFSLSATEKYYHGGVIASLIDLAGHAVIATHTGGVAPTIDLRIDYLRPAPGVSLFAHAIALSIGRTMGRADIQIIAQGKTVAVGRGAFRVLG